MATIAWTDEARRWLEDIFEYVAADNPHAAVRTVKTFTSGRKSSQHFQKSDTVTLPLRETSEFCHMAITELPTA